MNIAKHTAKSREAFAAGEPITRRLRVRPKDLRGELVDDNNIPYIVITRQC